MFDVFECKDDSLENQFEGHYPASTIVCQEKNYQIFPKNKAELFYQLSPCIFR